VAIELGHLSKLVLRKVKMSVRKRKGKKKERRRLR
jgi:hypothetical protein